MADEPRELTPVQLFWQNKGISDFAPHVQKVVPEEVRSEGPTQAELDEIAEADAAMTPVPKGEPAQESVPFEESRASIAPDQLASPVLASADSESGKVSESNADEPPTRSPPKPAPASSSPSSSSVTSPGKPTPPAPVKPPTRG